MRNIVLSAIATSAAWAIAVLALLHWEFYYLISASDMQALSEQFERVYNAGYHAIIALQECRKAI
jgi:hypothetical protein